MSRDDSKGSSLRIERCPVRYIKLGSGNRWAAALDEGLLEWGSEIDRGAIAAGGDWDKARAHYVARDVVSGTASSYVRELKDFYTLDADVLWITFARDRLWWAFADIDVLQRDVPDGSRGIVARRTIGPWRCTNVLGVELIQSQLSSALTKVAAYKMTMCNVAAEDYLFRVINGEANAELANAQASLSALLHSIEPLIQQLHWSDFELLVDLIFSHGGWRRISRLGGAMKDHDLVLEQPITRRRVSVQVKSRAEQREHADALADRLGQANLHPFERVETRLVDHVLQPERQRIMHLLEI